MTVFFTCSTREISRYKGYYREIRNAILNLGHHINRDWIESSIEISEKGKKDVSPSTVYEKVLSAILTADVVVVDSTVRSMSIGHQISFALSKNKPVLVLRYTGSDGKIDELFINNEKSNFLTIKEYSHSEELLPLIKNYFDNESTPKTRFNLVMNREQNNYIEWAAYNYNKSKTDIILEAITEKASQDLSYKKNKKRIS